MSSQQIEAIEKTSLDEILDKTGENTTIFNEYISKKEIGEKIFKELTKRYAKDKGFYMQDNSKEVGILSQCHCLQTLMSLAQDFDLTFEKTASGDKGNIRNIMDDVIDKIINKNIKKVTETGVEYVFDASPYDTDHFSEEYSNVDTITWVVTSFLMVLKYHAQIGEVCKWETDLIDIIKKGMDYINDKAFIPGSDGANGLDTGWNFTKDCPEPSLYFSFTVCECYLDMYSTFEDILKYLHMERNALEYGVPVDERVQTKFYEQARKYEIDRTKEVGALKARSDMYNELARIFRLINDIDDTAPLNINEDTRYGKFEKHCKDVARKVWQHVQKNLADSFFYNNLTDTLTEADIRSATTSDSLFNTVYIISIMVSTGLDEVLELERQKALLEGNVTDARKKEQEYNNLLESCLLAVQKALRTYESLKNDGKEYIVDQFLIGFNERFGDHPVAINELRKLRMRCFSLLPMLIHINNVVSEYLVKYPQYNMRKYLEYILDNRLKTKDDKRSWIWESDGYFSGSNYYYVLTLNEFYLYYEEYEHKYIGIGEDNAKRETAIKDQYLQELRAPGGEIYDILDTKKAELEEKAEELALREKKIADLEQKIRSLKQELDSIERPVEDAVRKVVAEELESSLAAAMESKMAGVLKQVFTHTAKVLTASFVDPTEDEDELYAGLSDAMREMLVTSMLNQFVSSPLSKVKTPQDYAILKSKLDSDLDGVVGFYIENVRTTPKDSGSNLQKVVQSQG